MRNQGAAIHVYKRLFLCSLLQPLQTPWVTIFQIERQETGWGQTDLIRGSWCQYNAFILFVFLLRLMRVGGVGGQRQVAQIIISHICYILPLSRTPTNFLLLDTLGVCIKGLKDAK